MPTRDLRRKRDGGSRELCLLETGVWEEDRQSSGVLSSSVAEIRGLTYSLKPRVKLSVDCELLVDKIVQELGAAGRVTGESPMQRRGKGMCRAVNGNVKTRCLVSMSL